MARLLFIVAVALAAGACTVGSTGAPCLRQSDCLAGLACGANDRCVVPPDAPNPDAGPADATTISHPDAAPVAAADADPTPDAPGL